MAMKFLNKKGWHTGSLRNIERVWKAEQKQEDEQKKLEEIHLQILEEKERSEFNAIKEQAGLVPRRPERLEFMYDSGFAVANQDQGARGADAGVNSNNKKQKKQKQSSPGALFDDKEHFANDSWRKFHSDPLLLIRQHEQEARKSVKEKRKRKDGDTNEHNRRRLRRL